MELLQNFYKIQKQFGINTVIDLIYHTLNDNDNNIYKELICSEQRKENWFHNVNGINIGSSSSLNGQFEHRIQFNSPYFSARVIGKNGQLIKTIQNMSKTIITSPKCLDPIKIYNKLHPKNKSINLLNETTNDDGDNSSTSQTSSSSSSSSYEYYFYNNNKNLQYYRDEYFKISSTNLQLLEYARSLIIAVGIFFWQKFQLMIKPGPNEFCLMIEVLPESIQFLLRGRGLRIKSIQWLLNVRIISPKCYSRPCIFYIIGKEADVSIAKLLFADLMIGYQQEEMKYYHQKIRKYQPKQHYY